MIQHIPCISSTAAGTNDPMLRRLLVDAAKKAGPDLADALLTLYNHDSFLLVTWQDDAVRSKWSQLISQLWSERTDDAPLLHFICSDEDYTYDEDDFDHGAHL